MKTARTAFPAAVVPCLLALAGAFAPACGGGETEPKPAAGAAAKGGAAEAGAPAGKGAKGAAQKPKGAASAMVAYQNALQLLLQGDPPKAREELVRAVELDPKLSEARFELGKLELHLSSQIIGSQARDLDVLDHGVTELEAARDLEPANDHYWYWLGRAYGLQKQPEKALAALQKAVELNPKHGPAWKKLGNLLRDAGRMEEARASFLKAIEIDPNEAGAYFQLGQSLEMLSKLPDAREAYEKSIALDPTSPEVFQRLTLVCAMLGDAEGEARARTGMDAWKEYDEKLQRRRRAVNQKPGDAAALRRLGEMYFEVGNWEESLDWFLKAIHIDPKDSLTHLYCGVAKRHMRDFASSANHLKEAEFLAPDMLDPKLELLQLYGESGDEASLGELLASVEEAAVADGASLFALGEVCQGLGRGPDAERLFGKAKALGVTEAAPAAAAPTEGQ
jgi:tetratricopeptide (TPR) repeat protein